MQWPQIEARWFFRAVLVLACAAGLSACAGEEVPQVPGAAEGTADPVLVQGRDVWQTNCARCHGGAGGGGAGPALQGPWADGRQPDVETMSSVIHNGRGAMPRFGNSLSDEEIDAVIRYIREVL